MDLLKLSAISITESTNTLMQSANLQAELINKQLELINMRLATNWNTPSRNSQSTSTDDQISSRILTNSETTSSYAQTSLISLESSSSLTSVDLQDNVTNSSSNLSSNPSPIESTDNLLDNTHQVRTSFDGTLPKTQSFKMFYIPSNSDVVEECTECILCKPRTMPREFYWRCCKKHRMIYCTRSHEVLSTVRDSSLHNIKPWKQTKHPRRRKEVDHHHHHHQVNQHRQLSLMQGVQTNRVLEKSMSCL